MTRNLGKRHEPRLARVFGQRGQYRKAKRHLFDVSCDGECPVKVCRTKAPSSNETACNNSQYCKAIVMRRFVRITALHQVHNNLQCLGDPRQQRQNEANMLMNSGQGLMNNAYRPYTPAPTIGGTGGIFCQRIGNYVNCN